MTYERNRKTAEQSLLDTGTLVMFRVVDTHTEVSPDKENVFVRAELVLTDDDPDTEPAEIVEWSAFGFLFTLAALSFHDARPRGISGADFEPKDEFTVADFFECLWVANCYSSCYRELSWSTESLCPSN